tara:strand:+ start:620 stop:934 length:315 start_codon:yes stop_codon:yes gene_type:complete
MHSKLDFSIIISALNEAFLIEDTFDNVIKLMPVNKKFEVILINDCNSDNTDKIMENITSTFECTSVLVMDHKNDHKSSALGLNNIYSFIKDFLLLIQSVRNEKY